MLVSYGIESKICGDFAIYFSAKDLKSIFLLLMLVNFIQTFCSWFVWIALFFFFKPFIPLVSYCWCTLVHFVTNEFFYVQSCCRLWSPFISVYLCVGKEETFSCTCNCEQTVVVPVDSRTYPNVVCDKHVIIPKWCVKHHVSVKTHFNIYALNWVVSKPRIKPVKKR